MYNFIIQRILASVPVVFVVLVFVFLLLHLSAGDPAAVIAGQYAKPEDIARVREHLGLDQPIIVQFAKWLGRLMQGDLGVSIFTQRSVLELISQRLEPTISLAITTMSLTVLIAVPLGMLAAWKAGTWVDHALMGFAVLGFSVPVFIFAYILIYGFALEWKLFPVQGYASIRDGFWPFIHRLVLPSCALALGLTALLARITRASTLEILGEDFVRTARAKGMTEREVLVGHVLKNAGVPILTVIGFSIVLLIGGVVITETVFNIPGIGRLTVDSVLRRDYPVIQGLILVFALANVVVNLLIDIAYTVIDPRIRY